MRRVLDLLFSIFKYHKKKIVFLISSISFCVLMLFPYDDLSDYITLFVTRQTRSNVYLQFDGLSFSVLPGLGVKMRNVVVESAFSPTLSLDSLVIAPKLSSLLFGSVGAAIKAQGLFKGEGSVDVKPSRELEVDSPQFQISADLESIDLKELSKYLEQSLPNMVAVQGTGQLSSEFHIDQTYKAQPKGQVSLTIKNFELPSLNLMGLVIPSLAMNEILLTGKFSDRKFVIEKGQLGKVGNELYGNITGEMFFEMLPGNRLKLGGYELDVDLSLSQNLQKQLSGVLSFVDAIQNIGERHKFSSLNGIQYAMHLSARSTDAMPKISPKQK